MNKATHIISFDYFLSFFTKDNLKYLMDVVRLLVILKPTDGTFKHDESEFEDIEGTFDFQVYRLTYRTFHKVFLSHIHLKYA